VRVSIKADVSKAASRLSDLQRKQIPYAVSVALNDTAYAVKQDIVDRVWPGSFEQRNRAFPKALFAVQKATKRSWQSVVYQKLDRDYVSGHIKGVTRTARRGGSIAIPVSVKRGSRGVPASRRPRALRNTYVAEAGRGEGIWQKGPRQRVPRLMYMLRRMVPNPKRFPFYTEGERTVRRIAPSALEKSLDRAIRTAR
jgi:hypothetical protein